MQATTCLSRPPAAHDGAGTVAFLWRSSDAAERLHHGGHLVAERCSNGWTNVAGGGLTWRYVTGVSKRPPRKRGRNISPHDVGHLAEHLLEHEPDLLGMAPRVADLCVARESMRSPLRRARGFFPSLETPSRPDHNPGWAPRAGPSGVGHDGQVLFVSTCLGLSVRRRKRAPRASAIKRDVTRFSAPPSGPS